MVISPPDIKFERHRTDVTVITNVIANHATAAPKTAQFTSPDKVEFINPNRSIGTVTYPGNHLS
ncbi:hypothetical protein AA11825_2375 [Acetobacter pomorum DSM 11825]|nr:hypothetical protein AA11825_2375 [Acetobacter pomorum DSM 11825]